MAKPTTLDTFATRREAPLKVNTFSPDVCPLCVQQPPPARARTPAYTRASLPVLDKLRYAKDYVIRGCKRCGRTFWYDKAHKRLIELVMRYGDIFDDKEGGEEV